MKLPKPIRALLWWPLVPRRQRRVADTGGSTLRALYRGYSGAPPGHPDPIYGAALQLPAAVEVLHGRRP